MAESTKINFISNRIYRLSDYTELIELLFPGNRNQQRAAASILFELKWTDSIEPNLVYIENKYGISRRTLQRTRAKLSRLGLIEHVSYLNSRYGGQSGWKLSTRFSSSLRKLAEYADLWSKEKGAKTQEKERMLMDLLI
jgi:hypothetical protein